MKKCKGFNIKVDRLPEGAHIKAGEFDKSGRWFPEKSFCVPGSFSVRGPSRSWPCSYLQHFYSRAYAARLALQKPALYFFLTGTAPESEDGRAIIAAHTALCMQRKGRRI